MILKQDPDDMISIAEKYITNNERSLFDDFFACFEKYCSENGLIFIGTSAVNYMKKWDSPETFAKSRLMYSLHVVHSDPRKHAESVSKLLTEVHSRHIDPRTVSYLHVPASNEYDIFVNMRLCFKIGTVPDFRGNPITKYIDTVPGSAIWNDNLGIKCMPASFILPVFLRSMYDVNAPQLENPENTIQFLLSKIGKENNVNGSREKHARGRGKKQKHHPASEITGMYKQPGTRENYVYDGSIEELKATVKKTIPYIRDIIRYYMYDMDDTFMAKYTFYDNDKKPVFSVFNCCDYHTVPIHNGEVSSIAAARLRIIEANMLNIMESAGVGKFNDARKKCMEEFWDCMSIEHTYDGFIGTCVKWDLLKKQMQKYRSYKTPIYPAASKNVNANVTGSHDYRPHECPHGEQCNLSYGDEPHMHHYFALEM